MFGYRTKYETKVQAKLESKSIRLLVRNKVCIEKFRRLTRLKRC